MLWACIFLRIFVNPLSNVFQKLLTGRAISPWLIVGITHGILAVACLPLLFFIPIPKTADFWLNITISRIGHCGQRPLGLRDADLGPVSAGTR